MARIDELNERYQRSYEYTRLKFRHDYLSEIDRFDTKKWEAPQRAARLSAIVKKFKTSQMIKFILKIQEETEIDLTPLAVRRLTKILFNRTGSQKIIVGMFGQKHRGDKSRDSSIDVVEFWASQYQAKANVYWKRSLKRIQIVKQKYQRTIYSQNRSAAKS